MDITVTSFKKSYVCMVALSAPDPAAGHCQPMPLLETPGHSQASVGQSLVGSLPLSSGSWCVQGVLFFFVFFTQDSEVEGPALMFSCENSKITTHC